MNIKQIPTAIILQDIAKFQNAQKRYAPSTHTHQQCSTQLAPLFVEMARRQKEGIKC